MLEIGKSGLMSGEEKRVKSIPRSFSTPPNFGLFPFFLGLYELVVGSVEGAFGGGVVADEESQGGGKAEFVDGERDAEVAVLEADGAEGEPVGLRHGFDEYLFGRGGGLVFVLEVGEERVELVLVFAGHDGFGGLEAVRETVFAGSGFAFGGLRAGRFLRI